MKLLFPQQNYNVLSPSFYTHISVRDLYVPRIGLPILMQENMWTNHWQTHECWNWDWGRAVPRKGIHTWDFRAVLDIYIWKPTLYMYCQTHILFLLFIFTSVTFFLSLSKFPLNTFEDLHSIEWLKLYNNEIVTLHYELMEPVLDTLKHIDIHSE